MGATPQARRAELRWTAWQELQALLAVLAVIALAYLPTLSHGWVYDDAWTILANGYLRVDGDGWLLWSPEGRARNVPDAFRPTLVLFDRWSYRRLGLDPANHHAASLALHLSCCALAYRLLESWGAPQLSRLGATLLFGLLAVHAEAVAVISFREDLLAAALGLAALTLADAACRAPGRAWWFALVPVAGGAALACGAKLSAAPLPVVLWLTHAVDPWRTRDTLRETTRGRSVAFGLALAAGVGIAMWQRHLVLGGMSPYTTSGRPQTMALVDRLAASCVVQVQSLAQMLAPLGLAPEYVTLPWTWRDPATVLSAAGLLGAVGFALWCWRRRWSGPVAARGTYGLIAWVVLSAALLMGPTSNVVPLSNFRADRFLYLSSLPICVGASALTLWLGRRLGAWLDAPDDTRTNGPVDAEPHAPELAWSLIPLVVLVALQGAAALSASRAYASNATLWKVASAHAPGSARAQAMRGLMVLSQRPPSELEDPRPVAEALGHCRNAVRLDPHRDLGHICLGRVAVARREWNDAHEHYVRALAESRGVHDRLLGELIEVSVDASATDDAARLSRALAYVRMGRREYPYSPLVAGASGRALHRLGRPLAARVFYDRARRLYPERWQTAAWEVELDLDVGRQVRRDALRRPLRHRFHGSFRGVNVVQRDALEARITAQRRLFSPPFVQGFLDLLVQSQTPDSATGAERK